MAMGGAAVRGLGEIEAAVMATLWAAPAAMSVREVRDALADRRDWAYTTVMTVMDNLHKKGWLQRQRHGRAFIYQPVASREAYVAELMGEALRDSEDRPAAFLHFVRGISPEDSEALRGALARVRGPGRRWR